MTNKKNYTNDEYLNSDNKTELANVDSVGENIIFDKINLEHISGISRYILQVINHTMKEDNLTKDLEMAYQIKEKADRSNALKNIKIKVDELAEEKEADINRLNQAYYKFQKNFVKNKTLGPNIVSIIIQKLP